MNTIFRIAAIQGAAARQLEYGDRVNISGIAAITGLHRGDVSRALNTGFAIGAAKRHQNATNEILTAWYHAPRFLTRDNRPKKLKIFGSGVTFESLVKTYGHGIPVRAILDELARIGAVRLDAASKTVVPSMPLAIDPRITKKKIKEIDFAASEILSSLLNRENAAFVERISGAKEWSGSPAFVRKRFRSNSISLLREVKDKLTKSQAKLRENTQSVARLNISFVCRDAHSKSEKHISRNRRNFRRSH